VDFDEQGAYFPHLNRAFPYGSSPERPNVDLEWTEEQLLVMYAIKMGYSCFVSGCAGTHYLNVSAPN
jgi:hypothetical protein